MDSILWHWHSPFLGISPSRIHCLCIFDVVGWVLFCLFLLFVWLWLFPFVVQTLEQWALWVWHYYNKTQDSRWQPSPPWSGYNLYGRHFNICSNLLVKNYPHIQWKIHNFFNFWATAIKFHDFIDISFLHVFTRNEVSCGNHYFEKYAAKSTLWKFCCVKVMGKYSLRVYGESFTV